MREIFSGWEGERQSEYYGEMMRAPDAGEWVANILLAAANYPEAQEALRLLGAVQAERVMAWEPTYQELLAQSKRDMAEIAQLRRELDTAVQAEHSRVHNHGPEEGPGLACSERLVGECLLRQAERPRAPSEAAISAALAEDWTKLGEDRRATTIRVLRAAYRVDALQGAPNEETEHES